jgi:hypothetical protein
MKKLNNFVLSAGLLAVIAGAPGCATVADKIIKDDDVAGTYVNDEQLRNEINTLLNMYKWGFTRGMPTIIENIYDKIPDDKEHNFFIIDAIHANYLRKNAVATGDESMYLASEAKFGESFVKMDESLNDSNLDKETWLNSDQFINNRLGKWVLFDSFGLLKRDYVVAGINEKDSRSTLYQALVYLEMGKQLVEDLDGQWNALEGVSQKHIERVHGLLDKLTD